MSGDAVRLRTTPEEFRVDEVPLYAPAGEGDHTFLHIEKRLRSTEQVARDLARAAGVRAGDVGFAGRKDRDAVTTQWFSVPGLDPPRALALSLPGARVLQAARHPHKLRTGHLRANVFRIVLRGVPAARADALAGRLGDLARRGMPNRFGGQRFAGDGVERGRRLLAGERVPRDRRRARFWVSAFQAAVFNAALAAREAPLGALEEGDVAIVHASGGLFVVDDPAREAPRAAAFEISATGPLFGTRAMQPTGAVAERERRILAEHGVCLDTLAVPRGLRLRGGRRALRVRPEEARLETVADGVCLHFRLPPGSYATVLVEELAGSDDSGDAERLC